MLNLIEKVYAATADATTKTLDDLHVPGSTVTDKTSLSLGSVTQTVIYVTSWIMNLIGYVAAIYFLYGTILYIISFGNDAKAQKAKQTMINALIGLAIAVLARFIIYFVKSYFVSTVKF